MFCKDHRMSAENRLILFSKNIDMLKYKKMVAEILTDRYIKIVEENNMQFFRYKECCNESALKEMESENDKNLENGNKPRSVYR